jgi:hypothetical protein
MEDAVKALTKLRGKDHPDDIQAELDEIHANIMWHKQYSVTSTKVFFTDKALWSRLWRAWAISFLQQMSGAGGIRYYLPTNFRAAGTSETLSLLASGLDGTVQVGCTAAGIFLIDRIGRRHALGGGAIIMAFCLLVSPPPFTHYVVSDLIPNVCVYQDQRGSSTCVPKPIQRLCKLLQHILYFLLHRRM